MARFVAAEIVVEDGEIVVGDKIAAENIVGVERAIEIAVDDKMMVVKNEVDKESVIEKDIDAGMGSENVDIAATVEKNIDYSDAANFVAEVHLDVVVTSAQFDYMSLATTDEHCNDCCRYLAALKQLKRELNVA